jgi:hypothetical protein
MRMARALRTSQPPVELEVQRRQAAIDRTRGVLTPLAPGRSLVDELVAERRAEARAEKRTETTQHPVAKR